MWPASCPPDASPKAKWDLGHTDWSKVGAEGGPDDGVVFAERADAAYRGGEHAAAAVWWTRAIEEMAARAIVTRPLETHPLYWTVLRSLTECHLTLGNHQQAIEGFQKLIANDDATAAIFGDCISLGECHEAVQQHQKAIEAFERALMLAREAGDGTPQPWLLGKIGLCLHCTRNHRQALEHLQHSLHLDKTQNLFQRLRAVGESHIALGLYRGALEYLSQSAAVCEAGEDPVNEAKVWRSMQQCHEMLDERQQVAWTADATAGARLAAVGMAHHSRGEYNVAIEKLGEAAVVRRRLKQVRAEGTALAQGALCLQATGRNWEAIKWLENARDQFKASSDKVGQQRCWALMADCYETEKEWRVASRHWRVALRMLTADQGDSCKVQYLARLAECFRQLCEYSDALGYFAQLAELGVDEASQWEAMAECHVALNQHRAAIGCYQRAFDALEPPTDVSQHAVVLENMATCHYLLGEYVKSSRIHREALQYKREKTMTAGPKERAMQLVAMTPQQRQVALRVMPAEELSKVLIAMSVEERHQVLQTLGEAERAAAVHAMSPAQFSDFERDLSAWGATVRASEQSEQEWFLQLQSGLKMKRLMAMPLKERAAALAAMSRQESADALAAMSAVDRAAASDAMLNHQHSERERNEQRIAEMMAELQRSKDATNGHQATAEDRDKALKAVAAEKERIEKAAEAQTRALQETNIKVAALTADKERMESRLQQSERNTPKVAADKPSWAIDDKVSHCRDCGAEFDLITRRHHCRGCGLIFCDDCSDKKLYCLPWARGQESRVCSSCFGGACFVPSNGKGDSGNSAAAVEPQETIPQHLILEESPTDDGRRETLGLGIFSDLGIGDSSENKLSEISDDRITNGSRKTLGLEIFSDLDIGDLSRERDLSGNKGARAEASEEDVAMLVTIGVDEVRARLVLDECGGDLDLAMDKALA